jgi:hypothetical protein
LWLVVFLAFSTSALVTGESSKAKINDLPGPWRVWIEQEVFPLDFQGAEGGIP